MHIRQNYCYIEFVEYVKVQIGGWLKLKKVGFYTLLVVLYVVCITYLLHRYRKSSIRSRPCIILKPKFPRLVLDIVA